jgi:hypothetical protein
VFGETSGIRLVEESERLMLVIDDSFVVRFKFLNRGKRTINYPTSASLKMDAQLPIRIAGIERLPRVVLGYTLGGVPLALDGTFVLFAVDNKPMWHYGIDGKDAESRVLPFEDEDMPAEHEFRMVGDADESDESAKKGG